MSDLRWYRSLYWRIGLGLFAFLALMLAAQGALFLWITDRIAGSMPASSPQRLAELVSSDISVALSDDPTLDLTEYVRAQYGHVFQAFVVTMRDGRTVTNDEDVPEGLLDNLRADAERRFEFPLRRFPPREFGRGAGFPGRGGGPRGEGFPRRSRFPDGSPESAAADPSDREGPNRPLVPRGNLAPIIVGNALVGEVAVIAGGPPLSRIARELGPTMGVVGGGILAVGVALIAFVVFGPVRRRLKHVQDATERLGQGDLQARAPEQGGDEVAAVASSFNRMAAELAARADALQSSDRTRRQLLADVSHELNTPLTAMRGYLETLSMPDVSIDAATRQRYLGIVTEESYRLERIVGDLLDLARLEGGGTAMRRTIVDVPALFERVAKRHEREMADRNVRLVLRGRGRRRKRSPATRTASNRRCRTSRPTPCVTRRTAVPSTCRPTRVDTSRPPARQRHGARDRARAPAENLRPVLQGRRLAEGGRRQRSRAVDREGHRGAPRRHDHRQQRQRRGLRDPPASQTRLTPQATESRRHRKRSGLKPDISVPLCLCGPYR